MMNHNKALELTNGRVGYYWEAKDCYPTVEVFLKDVNVEYVEKCLWEIEKTIRDMEIGQSIVDFDYEQFSDNYFRIMGAFDFEYTDENTFLIVIEELEKYGDDVWEEVYS